MVDFNSEEIAISNKRKRQENDNINWKLMVSASSTRNYFLNDPIIDWIKEYNIKSIHDLPSIKGNSESTVKYVIDDPFTKFIMDQGCQFEEKVINIIVFSSLF